VRGKDSDLEKSFSTAGEATAREPNYPKEAVLRAVQFLQQGSSIWRQEKLFSILEVEKES